MKDATDDKSIHIASRINFSERLPGGIGARQVVLVGAAVAQAIYLLFVFDAAPFAVRVTVAMVVAFVLLALAMLRPRGNSPEGLLAALVRWLVLPRYRLFQTAERVDRTLYPGDQVVGSAGPARAERGPFPLEWDRANIALILFCFMALLTLSTALVWAAQHGHVGVPRGW